MRKFVSYDSHYALDAIYHFQLTAFIRRFSPPLDGTSGTAELGATPLFFGLDRNGQEILVYNKPGLAPGPRIHPVRGLCESTACSQCHRSA